MSSRRRFSQRPRGLSTRTGLLGRPRFTRRDREHPSLEPGDLLTLQDAADRLTTSYKTVFRLVTDRHLRAFKVGGQWRVHKDDLAAYAFGGSMAESKGRHPREDAAK